MRFGDFVAVDSVSFRIRRGEIFGFLGSSGCMSPDVKMLTDTAEKSEGRAWLFGHGWMRGLDATAASATSQAFTLAKKSRYARTWSCTPAVQPRPLRTFRAACRRDGGAASAWWRKSSTTASFASGDTPAPRRWQSPPRYKPELLILDEPTSGSIR